MRPCSKCSHNYWKFETIKTFDEKFKFSHIKATCDNCGNIVEFGYEKTKKKEEAKAEYSIRGDKRFLKIDGKFVEVCLKQVKKGFKVCPVNSSQPCLYK